MAKIKLTCSKINELIKDEEMGVSEYRKAGLTKIANQEQKHLNYLKKLKKQRKC